MHTRFRPLLMMALAWSAMLGGLGAFGLSQGQGLSVPLPQVPLVRPQEVITAEAQARAQAKDAALGGWLESYFNVTNAAELSTQAINLSSLQTAGLPDGWSFAGGGMIISGRKGVGGVSGLAAQWNSQGGLDLLAVSDVGYWLGARLENAQGDGAGRLDRLTVHSVAQIETLAGFRPRSSQSNAEAIAVTDAGDLLVAFEGDHRVQVHPNQAKPSRILSVPTALRTAPNTLAASNGGIEALAVLPSGELFAVGEGVQRQGGLRAWVFGASDADWATAVYRRDVEDGYAWTPTAAASFGDQLYLVERWWDRGLLFRARLVSLPIADVVAGALLEPQVVLDLSPIVGTFGNVESLAVLPASAREGEQRMLVIIATDNQEFALLPTQIVALAFDPAEAGAVAGDAAGQ